MWNRTPLTKLLGIDYPIVQAPFGGQDSCVELVARVSASGGLGSFGMHALDGEQIRRAVRRIRDRTSRPFAANLWLPRDEPWPRANRALGHGSTPYYEELGLTSGGLSPCDCPDLTEQLDAVLDARPPVFSFIFGVPSERILALCRERGIITMGSVASMEEAVALELAGVDCIVVSTYEVGKHPEHFIRPPDESLAGMLALLPQMVACLHLPIVAAGDIGDARGVATALALGAHGVQIGSAFLARLASRVGRKLRSH